MPDWQQNPQRGTAATIALGEVIAIHTVLLNILVCLSKDIFKIEMPLEGLYSWFTFRMEQKNKNKKNLQIQILHLQSKQNQVLCSNSYKFNA